MGKVLGIDLGTTNSCMAVIEGGEPVVIPNAEGNRTTPSVVAFRKDGERLVGEVAKRQAVLNPERTISSVKRRIGSRHRYDIDGKGYSPEEISAMILGKLKADAEAYLGEPVTEAVITVPAYFDDAQRTATKNAGEIAGLTVLRIINEPTAASLAYGLDKETDETILVYDLGGGTFDVSLLEVGDGVFEVKATSGDTRLGGDDFDQAVVDWLAAEFKKEHGIDLTADPAAVQRLRTAAEKAKKELSSQTSTEINEPFISGSPDGGPVHLVMQLTRARFDELVVAVGAAIQAGILAGDVENVVLLDVTPLSLGIETLGGVFDKIVERNTTIPVTRTRTYSTAEDSQTAVDIQVYTGEREQARLNKLLGQFRLDGIPPAPRGIPQVEVSFDIDPNGILNVTARDKATGREQKVTIEQRGALDDSEISRMVQDADKYRDEDQKFRERQNARNELDALVLSLERLLRDNGDKLDAGEKQTVEDAVKRAKEVLADEGATTERFNQAKDELQQASYQIAEKLYAASSAAEPPADGATAGPSDDPDVIDAEFSEQDEK